MPVPLRLKNEAKICQTGYGCEKKSFFIKIKAYNRD
jgi:hypothetical protein